MLPPKTAWRHDQPRLANPVARLARGFVDHVAQHRFRVPLPCGRQAEALWLIGSLSPRR